MVWSALAAVRLISVRPVMLNDCVLLMLVSSSVSVLVPPMVIPVPLKLSRATVVGASTSMVEPGLLPKLATWPLALGMLLLAQLPGVFQPEPAVPDQTRWSLAS